MTDEHNVTHLKPIHTGLSAKKDAEGFLGELCNFVKEQGLILEWGEEDIELDHARSDETKLGELNYFERELYILAQLLNQCIRDEMVEIQASNTDTIAAVMREKKISIEQAAQEIAQRGEENLDPETQAMILQLAVTSGTANSMFEWLVRSRHQEWTKRLIVRKGFIVYSYG